jgi:teichuronic acid biosynthesis glycosyltransferase TuaC
MRILTLATLFPNHLRPNFGIFVERQTRELASREGVSVTVINPIGMPPWPLSRVGQYKALAQLPAREARNGLDVYRPIFPLIPRFGGRWNPKFIAASVLPLLRRLHDEQPFDAIDAEFFYPDGPAAMRIAAALDIPFSIKARGADIHHWGMQPGCADQIRQAADKAHGLLSVAKALKADMVRLGIAEDKIRVHYTGCDQHIFTPLDRPAVRAELGITGPMVLTVGALIPRKGQHHAIAALTMLPDVTLVVAGQGPEEGDYRLLAKKLGVADRVRFVGNIAHAELPKWINAADAMVLVSAAEGLANAWVEALACGTPIIISDAGGARELLRDPVAGRIVAANAEAIATAVKAIMANPPDPAAVRACVRDFTWARNGDDLVAHFEGIVGR